MIFFDLSFSVKDELMKVLRDCFSDNPHYSSIHISDKFSYEPKKLPAIIMKNAAGSTERAGTEDFIKDMTTTTGDVVETFKIGESIKSVKRRDGHLLYCIQKHEVFRIDVLENNQIQVTRGNPLSRFGPLTVVPGSTLTDLILDVDIELDTVLVPGDTIVVLLVPINGAIAKLYGGLNEMEMSLTVLAQTTTQLEAVADWTWVYLNFVKKLELEREKNILIKTVRHSGEAELQEYKDYIYTAGIDISLRSQWAWPVKITQWIASTDILVSDIPQKTCDGIPISIID